MKKRNDMKLLTLIRHAKSDWRDCSVPDIKRPLNPRGLNDAPLMGNIIRERGFRFLAGWERKPQFLIGLSAVVTPSSTNPPDAGGDCRFENEAGSAIPRVLRCRLHRGIRHGDRWT